MAEALEPLPWNDFSNAIANQYDAVEPVDPRVWGPPPSVADGFSLEAVNAANIVRLFHTLTIEVAEKRNIVKNLRLVMDEAVQIADGVAHAHTKFMSAIVPFDNPRVQRLNDLITEYTPAQRELFDAWKVDIVRRLEEATTAVENLDDEIALIRTMLVEGAREVVKAPDAESGRKLCPLCFEAEVGVVCVPCGHTVCQGCAKNVGRRCSTCRSDVRETIKLYFSV